MKRIVYKIPTDTYEADGEWRTSIGITHTSSIVVGREYSIIKLRATDEQATLIALCRNVTSIMEDK